MGAADPLLGRRLAGGKVELQAALGEGGMGRVYRGFHHELGVPVAVKVLLPGRGDRNVGRRLLQEAAAARRVSHPNLIQVLESGTDPFDNLLYVVMEFVDGRDLGSLLSGGRTVDVRRACGVLVQVLAGLDAAHRANILHRDIKPGNVMLTRVRRPDGHVSDVVKVVDFGLAKLTTGEQASLTGTGLVVGTPGYMAPEQLLDEPLDARVDVFACGVMLYRLLVGTVPYPADKAAMMLLQPQRSPPSVPGVPEPLQDAVRWALEPDRRARCPSAEALAERLRPFAEGTPGLPVSPRPAAAPDQPARFQLEGFGDDTAPDLLPTRDLPPAPSPAVGETVNQRSPRLATPAWRAAPQRTEAAPAVAVQAAPPGESVAARSPAAPPTRRRAAVVGAVLALAAAATGLVVQQRARAAREESVRKVESALAWGAVASAEALVLEHAEALADSPDGARLIRRVLEVSRAEAGLQEFDPSWRLEPSTWTGEVREPRLNLAHAFTLYVEQVEEPRFRGRLAWKDGEVSVRGLFDGNHLLFEDVAPLGKEIPGYTYRERKNGLVVRGVLEGTDGPNRVPLRAERSDGTGVDTAGLRPRAR